MSKCNKASAFLILKQYYIKFSFIFIIHSNEKSLNVEKWYEKSILVINFRISLHTVIVFTDVTWSGRSITLIGV